MPKQITRTRRSRSMVFTINNPSERLLEVHRSFNGPDDATHYVAQLEQGVVAGTTHLQGFVRWKNAKTFKAAMTILENGHFEVAKGSLSQNFEYCTKESTRVEGPWQRGFPRPRALPTVLRPWQRQATEIAASVPDDRTIHWIWDNGNTGKTKLQLLWHRDFNAILVDGNARDAKCAIKMAWGPDNSTGPPPHPVIMMNLPRDTQRPGLWPILESLKDGIFFSGKYEPGMMILPELHLFIFANEPPKCCSLSIDKMQVFRVDETSLVMRKAPWTLPVGEGVLFGPGF